MLQSVSMICESNREIEPFNVPILATLTYARRRLGNLGGTAVELS